MLDLGAAEQAGSMDDPAKQLVRALSQGIDQRGAPAHAAAEIRRRSEAGDTPIGLRRLSEVLAPSDQPSTPAPRHPADDPEAVAEVVRCSPCAVLDAAHPATVAQNLAAVLADGKRVLVTGPRPDELAAVRDALPDRVRGLCIDGPLPLSDTELRELRTLLVTVAPDQRSRLGQTLPPPNLVPTVEQVVELFRVAGSKGFPALDAVDQIPELLAELDPLRLSAVVDAAGRCVDALDELDTGDADPPWSRALLERALFGSARPELEALLRRCADLEFAGEQLHDAGDHMAVVGALPRHAVEQLRDYADYLDRGGRSRQYFRSAQQRAVEPVLRQLRLDGAPLKDSKLLRQALALVELVEGINELAGRCERLGVPRPVDVPTVATLSRQLLRIREAARAADNLRREVLFINAGSPVTLLDVSAVERAAKVIVKCGRPAGIATAQRRLAELADALETSASASAAAPEGVALVAALRAMDLPAYLEALPELAAARREQVDQRRLVELLSRLREAAPALAAIWADTELRGANRGTVRFVPLDELLDKLPEPDHADLVLLLDADSLGAEHLLVAAAAPRLVAVAPGVASAPPPELSSESADTVLGTLRRVGVPVIVGADTDDVVPAEDVADPILVRASEAGDAALSGVEPVGSDIERPTIPVPAQRHSPPGEFTSGKHAAPETPTYDIPDGSAHTLHEMPTHPVEAMPTRAMRETPMHAVPDSAVHEVPEMPTRAIPVSPGPAVPEVPNRAMPEVPANEVREMPTRAMRETPTSAVRDMTTKKSGTPMTPEPVDESTGSSNGARRFAITPLGIVAVDDDEDDHRAGA